MLLIDRKTFPRDKVCGGCLSGPAATRFREIIGSRSDRPGVPSTEITFVVGSYRVTCHPQGTTWMVPRSEMDACLVETAQEAGAETRFGSAATLERGERGWDPIIESEPIQTKLVLIASGLGGMPAKMGIRNVSTARRMVAQQWIQPARPPLPRLGGVELHWLRGGYVGLATPRPDECVVALASDVPTGADETPFEHLRRLNPGADVWNLFPADAPRRFDAKGTAGFPWMPDRLGDQNALLIGDAAGYAEPYSGEGIGQAMRSADCAVQAIMAEGDVLGAYSALMQQCHARVIRRTRMIRSVLRSPVVQYLSSKRPVMPAQWLAFLVERVHVRGVI